MTQGWSRWMTDILQMNGLLAVTSWTHNDMTDGSVTIDPKLIPRNRLKTFNVVWSTVRQMISQPRWIKVSYSRVVTKYDKQAHFSLFSPTISGKYLFIFDKLEEDNICLIISSSSGWVQLSLNSNPKKEWFVPVYNLTGPLLWNFNESSIGETRCFSFLGSQKKKLRKNPWVYFFVNLVSWAQKRIK